MDGSALRLDWLRAFVAFAETASFTAAAARLHLSQPALHTQVRLLGECVGVPLYRKVGRRLELTDAGREVEALARDVLGAIDAFAARRRGGEAAVPVVSAGRATHLYLLAPALRAWSGPLSLRTEDQAACAESVRTGRAHLGVSPLAEPDPDLDATLLVAVGQVALLPEGHGLASRKRLSVQDLAGLPLVAPPRGRPHRAALAAALGGDLTVVVEVDGWELMAHYAALGVGVAVVNAYVPVPPGVVAVRVFDLPMLRIHLLRRRGARLPPEADALAAHLVAALGDRAAPSS